MLRVLGLNEHGRPVGEDHHRAKLTDEEVELIRQMYEAGEGGYRRLATIFEVSKSTIRGIVNYRRRVQTVAGHKAVPISDGD